MRIQLALALAVLLAAPASAAIDSPAFGAHGAPVFRDYVVDGASDAPEPTIGIPWNTDSLFYQAYATTIKGVFDDDGEVTWTDVTPLGQTPTNLDPMLVADEDTGRVFAGGLLGPCSVMWYTDDDGSTWLPALNMCSGAQFDHQSIGIGPKPEIGNPTGMPQLQNAYYCGQLIAIGCSVSLDGGETWTVPTPAASQLVVPSGDEAAACTGFHGHWRISRVTGTATLPVGSCGDQHGFLVANLLMDGTQAGGVTGLLFEGRTVAGSHPWDGGFDPSIGFGRDEGWMYYGQADHMGARIAMSKDEGQSWESLGDSGLGGTSWLDVGQFHDPPVVAATFADVQAGDDDRAAFTFLGLLDTDGDGLPTEYGDADGFRAEHLYQCEPPSPTGNETREWHYFAAFTYDAGTSWAVHKLTDHPVQIGGIWDGGGGNPCRNLLDFNDMDIDSMGRVHIGYADGCLGDCLNSTDSRYSTEGHLLRQTTGRGLFAAFDVPSDLDGDGIMDSEDDDIDGDGIPNDEDATPMGGADAEPMDEEDKDTPGFAVVPVIALLGAVLALRRK